MYQRKYKATTKNSSNVVRLHCIRTKFTPKRYGIPRIRKTLLPIISRVCGCGTLS